MIFVAAHSSLHANKIKNQNAKKQNFIPRKILFLPLCKAVNQFELNWNRI